MRIETYPNGGGEVLHMWYDEIKDMNEADQEKVASEFIEEAFIENEEGYARYCCAIVHNAAAYLPDFLEYLGKFFIMSTEFDKNISDWSHDYTDHKNVNDFFMSLVTDYGRPESK